MTRLTLVQLILFAVVAAVVIPFGINYVIGPQAFGETIDVHAQMDNALGLTAGTVVTYRGVSIGKVSSVRLDPGTGGARVEFSLDPGVRVPVDSVAKVGMGTAIGIQNVDIFPTSDAGPFLATGEELAAPREQQPAQMSDLMLQASKLLESVDPQAVHDIGTELGASFAGLGPSLASLIDNGATMSEQLRAQAPQLAALLGQGSSLASAMAGQRDAFPRGALGALGAAEQLVAEAPAMTGLVATAPRTLSSASDLFSLYQGDFATMHADMGVVMPIISDRQASLRSGLVDIPFGLGKLASVVHGDRADFSLVATQGQVCGYDTPRRALGDTTPIDPSLTNYCPPRPNLAIRGAVNAPRPNSQGLAGSTTPGSVLGPPVVADPVLVPTGVEALSGWEDLLKSVQDGN